MKWPVVELATIAEVKLGRQRSPQNHVGPSMRKYLRAANVGWDGLLLGDVKQMNFTDAEMSTFRLEPGDLLLNEASGSPKEVGKPALWSGEIDDCAFQNTLLRVRPSSEVDPKYLLHHFSHQAAIGAFARGSRGVGIHHLGREALSTWPVPLPPLDEQRRIAAILDYASNLVNMRRHTVELFSNLTMSTFTEMFGARGSHLTGGTVSTIGDSLRLRSGQFLPASKQAQGPFYVYGGNGVNGRHNEYMFNDAKVIIGRVGVYCGVVHLTEPRSWVTDNALWVSEMPADTSLRYLAEALRVANLHRFASQSGQPLVSAGRLAEVRLPIPTVAAQNAFSARVRVYEKAAADAEASLRDFDALFASLQSRAFTGQL